MTQEESLRSLQEKMATLKKKIEHQRKRREELLKLTRGLGKGKREGTSSWEECVSDLGGKHTKAYHVTSLADKEGVCWGPTR